MFLWSYPFKANTPPMQAVYHTGIPLYLGNPQMPNRPASRIRQTKCLQGSGLYTRPLPVPGSGFNIPMTLENYCGVSQNRKKSIDLESVTKDVTHGEGFVAI